MKQENGMMIGRAPVCEALLTQFCEMSVKSFGENLVGIYLHGSASMGCFHEEKSDLDLILVVENEIPDAEKRAFLEGLAELNMRAPKKGFELSIVRRKYCDPFVYPTPYELHFSVAHEKWLREAPEDYVEKMKGTDRDLAAHFTIINHYGITLLGEDISKVFGAVPKEAYRDSILYDVENAREDILEHPMYMILNLCRVLAYLRENTVLSKKAGAEWGLKVLPKKFEKLLRQALECYESDGEMRPSKEDSLMFAEYMLHQIKVLCCRKVLVIGCPGSGKSTFAGALHKLIKLPLYHLDLMYWNEDRTIVPKEVFRERISRVLKQESWIIDGNYGATMEWRMGECDTVFFLDYPTQVCIQGVKERRGKPRKDMPWIEGEDEEDEEFIGFIKSYREQSRPEVLRLLEKYAEKNIVIFKSRKEAERFLEQTGEI